MPRRWLLIWKRSRRTGKSLHPRSRLASFPLKNEHSKALGKAGNSKKYMGKPLPCFIPCFQLSHPTGSAWDSCWRWTAQILRIGTALGNLVLKWWLASLHTAPVLFPAWSHLHLCLLRLHLCTINALYRVCTPFLLQDAEVAAFPGWTQRYWSLSQQCQPCSSCPLQKRQMCMLGTMHTWAGTISSSNCWHWIHSVLKREKNNLYKPNTQLQVKLKALTD